MKPIIVLPKKTMSQEDIKQLRDNELCVVEASDPSKVKFIDPIPSASQRGKIDQAAIQLSRILLNGTWGHYQNTNMLSRSDFARIYVDMLISGTALDSQGDTAEQEQRLITNARRSELEKLAREDARAERAAKKAAQSSTEKGKA